MNIAKRTGPAGGRRGLTVTSAAAAVIGIAVILPFAPWLGGWTLRVPLVVIPGGLIAILLLWIRKRQCDASRRSLRDLRRTHILTIEALSLAIDARDPHARGHVRRVKAFALELARRMGMPAAELEALGTAALLHDIGKLAVPDHLLHKAGKLTEREMQKIRLHASVGADILAGVDFPGPVLPIIRHHHERWDGSGYPDGLQGEAIPPGARILAVADALEALTSDRAYRVRRSPEEACTLITAWAGIHYDPEVARVLRGSLSEILDAGGRAEAMPERAAGACGAAGREIAGGESAESRRAGDPADAGGFGADLHRGIGARSRPRDAAEHSPAASDPRGYSPAGSSALRDISSAHREVYALYEIAQTLGSSLRLAEVLEMVIHQIGRLVPYYTCAIYLADPSGDKLVARFVSGANARELRGRALPIGAGVTGRAAVERRARLSPDPATDLDGTPIDPEIYSSAAAFPLFHEGRILGALTLYFPRGVACQDDHLRLMDIIAQLVSGAVFNGALFEETQESALTDDLTGLPNSRYLRQVFEQEMIRSQQAGQPMAFLAMDLDAFKVINDRLGHQVGDRFLAEVSRVLKRNLRDGDILVRLSGDEFAAVLPRTGYAQAALLTERLQQAVDIFSLRLDGGKSARAGVSIGIALYPDDGESFEELMLKADYNMYQNKAARKSLRQGRLPNVIPFPARSPGTHDM